MARFARMSLQAPWQRRAALAACCMAARRIVGRPGRGWRTSQRAQHAPGVHKRRRACPAAGKSLLAWAPGLLWWAAAPAGLWAHHDGSVSEGGRPADPSADRSIAFKRWPPGPLFGVDVKQNLIIFKGYAGNGWAKTSIPTEHNPQTGRGLTGCGNPVVCMRGTESLGKGNSTVYSMHMQ